MSVAASPVAGSEVLSFTVAGARLALPAADISEIIRPRPVTRVPHAPPGLMGVLNLHGTVLPVLSLAVLLGRAQEDATPGARIVVAANHGAPVGLLVDSVAALKPADDEHMLDLPALLAGVFGGLARSDRVAGPSPVPAAPEPAAQTADTILALIGFSVAGQDYALALADVVEVSALPADIATMPRGDVAMRGLVALRGALLPLVSLRALLGLPPDGFDAARARILVCRIGGALVGLVADALRKILRVPESSVDPVPPVLTRGRGEARIAAICRVDGGRRLVSILSPAGLFDSETAARVAASTMRQDGTDTTQETAMRSDAKTTGDMRQFVVFRLGTEQYGLPIEAVDEVVRRPDHVTRVPRAPAFVEGVMNLRGRVVPVIDQHARFGTPGSADAGTRRRVVIVTIDGLQAGFVVDEVSEILSVPGEDLKVAPDLAADGARVFDRIATLERDGRMILLVDPKALLDKAERDVLAGIAANTEAAQGGGTAAA